MGALTGAAALALLAAQADGAAPPIVADPPVEVAPAVPVSPEPVTPDLAPPKADPVATAEAPATEASAPPAEVAQVEAAQQGDAIVVSGRPSHDPLMGPNAVSFDFAQDVDRALVEPLAKVYKKALPRPARIGVGNFIRNLSAPVVFINDLLQLKPGRAFKTLIRFTVNTTVGLGGLIDVAKNKPFHLPYRHNGFANTLGYYGVKPGAYLYLPFLGPTTLRDVVGGAVDGVILPYGIGAPFNKLYYTLPNGALRSLNRRVEFDCQIQAIRSSSDPYAAARAYYLKKRQAEIDALHGRGNGPEPAAQCEAEALGEEQKPNPAPEPVPAPGE